MVTKRERFDSIFDAVSDYDRKITRLYSERDSILQRLVELSPVKVGDALTFPVDIFGKDVMECKGEVRNIRAVFKGRRPVLIVDAWRLKADGTPGKRTVRKYLNREDLV